jgi:hypothetical protein
MSWKYTSDLDDGFFPGLESVAADVEAKPIHLLSVMMSESGVRADAYNPNGNASGLVQFMPATLAGLGWQEGHAAFRQLAATEQLPFVRAYFLPHKGKLVSAAACYVATFLPALLGHADDPDFVLTAKTGPLGWAYAPNAVFDRNKDYAITVGELEDAIARNCRGPRWVEVTARLARHGVVPQPTDTTLDLRTTVGLQTALTRLGYDVGAIDGLPGPETRAGVVAFQRDRGLVVDGNFGPKTRAALEIALAKATNTS